MVNSEDYRNTDKCPSLADIESKKSILEARIQKQHPRVRIMYNSINKKQGEYFNDFAGIYNHKCAYCGAPRKFTDIRLFEVDHFVCESAFSDDTEGRAQAGKVSNLAFSCYSCNRGKHDLHIKADYQPVLNPDDNSITNIFSRDEQYCIGINNDYSKDELIKLFHKKLSFGSESRRLDFLLIEMDNLITQIQGSNMGLANGLEQCMGRLMQKKNNAIV